MLKTLLALLIVAAMASPVFGESLSPEHVVRVVLEAAHSNDLKRFVHYVDLVKIASAPRHSHDPESLLQMLRKIDLQKVVFQEVSRPGHPKTTVVRMTSPVSLDFNLELVPARQGEGMEEERYIVVAIHP